MSGLSEIEIIDRHSQALGEARTACQMLARQVDPELIAPRGHHYVSLKEALNMLEGSCRQLAHYRSDARWLQLGIVYAKAMRTAQRAFVGQRWQDFGMMTALFERGQRNMADLKDRRTGKKGAILPSNPSSWLVLPDHRVPTPLRTVH